MPLRYRARTMPSWIGFTVPSANTSHSATVKSVSAALVAACSVAVTGPVSSSVASSGSDTYETMSSRPIQATAVAERAHSAQQLRPTVSSTGSAGSYRNVSGASSVAGASNVSTPPARR